MTAPTFEIIGDGRLSDEAIEALAALLLSVAEAEGEAEVPDRRTAPECNKECDPCQA